MAWRRIARLAPVRRRHVATARLCCERNLLAATRRASSGSRPRILAYHAVGTPEWRDNNVAPSRFRRQLEWALEDGYHFVTAHEIAAGRATDKSLAITFDDGMRSAATTAAPILSELGIPWTLFVISGWADGDVKGWGEHLVLGWTEIEELVARGVSIGSHSVTHRNFASLSEDQVTHELEESKSHIESRLGIAVNEFAIPWGQSADWTEFAASAAADAGYTYVYAQAEDTKFPGTVGRTFVTRWDNARVFRAAVRGAFDRWEEWY